MWGWALLGSKTRDRLWHQVRSVQNYGSGGWARYVAACNLTIAGTQVETSGTRPGSGAPVCAQCELGD